MRTFTKTAKGQFYDETGVPLTHEQIDDFVNIAYKNIGVVFNAEGLKQEADGWYVGVDDNDPEQFHWFFAYKKTPFGKKFFAMGHDGTPAAKSELLKFKQQIFKDPSEHAYVEASGRVAQIMEAWGVPKVPVEKVLKALPGKQITPVDEYSYSRTLSGSSQAFTKTMYGYPKIAAEQKPGDIPPIDIGEGYWLVRVHTCADCDTWEVLSDDDKLFRVGEISLYYYPDLKFPSINAIYVNEKHRHTGIGQRIVRALARFYGGLMSDPQANTNEKAHRMWEGIGAEKVPSHRSQVKGWHWQFQSKLFKKAGGGITGYVLTPEARQLLLKAFPPKFPDVVAHHVTYSMSGMEPPEATVVVQGYACDDSLELAIVSVDGETQRPDGGIYHITLSLDRSKGRRPKDSNLVVAAWEEIDQPFDVQVHPGKIS